MFEELIDILDQTAAVYDRLLAHTEAERAALLAVDLGALQRLHAEKEALAAQARRLESARSAALARLPGAPTTLRALTASGGMDDPDATERLRRCGDRIKQTLNRLQIVNRRTADLLAHSLRVVRGSLRLLGVNARPATYARTGQPAVSGNGRLLSADA